MISLFLENLAWTFNGTKFGDFCWKWQEKARDCELRKEFKRR